MIFPRRTPIQNVEPLVMADWSNRNWEQEARDSFRHAAAFFRKFTNRA